MIRRPPRSTLFPTRRSSDLIALVQDRVPWAWESLAEVDQWFEDLRSEEHTSELQSHSDLVCRLLLEKKNIIRSSTRRHRIRVPTRYTKCTRTFIAALKQWVT